MIYWKIKWSKYAARLLLKPPQKQQINTCLYSGLWKANLTMIRNVILTLRSLNLHLVDGRMSSLIPYEVFVIHNTRSRLSARSQPCTNSFATTSSGGQYVSITKEVIGLFYDNNVCECGCTLQYPIPACSSFTCCYKWLRYLQNFLVYYLYLLSVAFDVSCPND